MNTLKVLNGRKTIRIFNKWTVPTWAAIVTALATVGVAAAAFLLVQHTEVSATAAGNVSMDYQTPEWACVLDGPGAIVSAGNGGLAGDLILSVSGITDASSVTCNIAAKPSTNGQQREFSLGTPSNPHVQASSPQVGQLFANPPGYQTIELTYEFAGMVPDEVISGEDANLSWVEYLP